MVASADTVVMGRVKEYRRAGEGEFPGLTGTFPRIQVTVDVDRFLKGSGTGTVDVFALASKDGGGGGGSCRLFSDLSVGKKYLLFLEGHAPPFTAGGVCSGSSYIYESGDVYLKDMPENVGATLLLEQERWLDEIRAVTGPGVAPATSAGTPALPLTVAAVALPLVFVLAASFVFPARKNRT